MASVSRLNNAGGKIVTERMLRIGHVDVKTGLVYFPEVAPRRANGAEPPIYDADLAYCDKLPAGDVREYFKGTSKSEPAA